MRDWFERVGRIFSIGTSTAAPNTSKSLHTIQIAVNKNDIPTDTPVLFHFGFASAIPVNGDHLMVSLGGDRRKSVIIASNHQGHTPTDLAVGQSVLYDAAGTQILLDAGNGIKQTSAGPIRLTSPDVVASGNLHAGSGATGSFTTPTGQIVTVRDGIIINIF